MKRMFAVAGILLLATELLAAGKGDAASGKSLFAKNCTACHAAGGEGKEAIGKMFKVTMRPLGSKEVQAKSDAQLRKDILEGNGKMKPVKLAPAEADDVVAFLRTLKQ